MGAARLERGCSIDGWETIALPTPSDERPLLDVLRQAMLRAGPPVCPKAHTFLKAWPSASRPVAVLCNDGYSYVVKGRNSGRQAVNDQIVGRLGSLLQAPVGVTGLIEVHEELIRAEPAMSHLSPGLAHGTRLIPHCTERAGLEHTGEPQNRDRFARLTVLFGWVGGNDHQFIYQNGEPHLVYSVDHGHFFPGGPDWTQGSLEQASAACLDPTIHAACSFSPAELQPACNLLAATSLEAVVEAIAAPPVDWGLTDEERVAVVAYLLRRRDELISSIGGI